MGDRRARNQSSAREQEDIDVSRNHLHVKRGWTAGHSQPGGQSGGAVFVSGSTPVDQATRAIQGVTIQEQTHQCLKNISASLRLERGTLRPEVRAFVIRSTSA
ncbi:MAG: RidA family protein [Acidobacteria bacterium]|nr:RidA family protein [Acidobacteriota bacterium]